jgi:hypothetical protein
MLEKKIEKQVCDYAKELGWLSFKNNPVMNKGIPDRTFIRDGVTVFIEFKRPGGTVAPLQKMWADVLRKHGVQCVTIWTAEEGKAFFEERGK